MTVPSFVPESPELFAVGNWTVHGLTLSGDKLKWLWDKTHEHKTLYSDLTRDDPDNFVMAMLHPGTVWLEIWEDNTKIVGMLWVTNLEQAVDANVHMMYFDRRPAEKDEVTMTAIRWFFREFPVHRLTAELPMIYHATIRLLERMGFKREGIKREALLIGGKWNDQAIYGITRAEVGVQWEALQKTLQAKPKLSLVSTQT
jgi:hypothetical protein